MNTKAKRKKSATSSRGNGAAPKQIATKRLLERKELGWYIVADKAICHGKPTFKGTRITVVNVLELIAVGMTWDQIGAAYYGRISKEAIAETVLLAGRALTENRRLLKRERR